MVRREDTLGGIYDFRSKKQCEKLGITISALPSIARMHMVLVVDIVRGEPGFVKVMTITSTLKNRGDYVPISPTPKKPYPIQLRFQNYFTCRGERIIPILPKYSYLKIDSYYEVPVESLVEHRDYCGNHFVILSRHSGGLRELQDYIGRRGSKLAPGGKYQELCRAMEELSLVSSE